MDRQEWEDMQLKPSDFSPLGFKMFKALFALGITVPILCCVYGLLSYWRDR